MYQDEQLKRDRSIRTDKEERMIGIERRGIEEEEQLRKNSRRGRVEDEELKKNA